LTLWYSRWPMRFFAPQAHLSAYLIVVQLPILEGKSALRVAIHQRGEEARWVFAPWWPYRAGNHLTLWYSRWPMRFFCTSSTYICVFNTGQ
jgi:hypothetical protein